MKRKTIFSIVCLLAGWSAAGTASAQSGRSEALDSVTVTATRVPMALHSSARIVTLARRDVLRMPDGKIVPEYYVLEYPTWVNIIAITTEGEFVLVRQYRHALGIVEYELCAGTMEASDASPLDAAKRELLEETGYAGGEWKELTALSANPTSMNNLNHTFIAKGVEKVAGQNLDETEEISVHLFKTDELIDLLRHDEMKQSLMVAPLWRYIAENHLI